MFKKKFDLKKIIVNQAKLKMNQDRLLNEFKFPPLKVNLMEQ